MNTLSLVSSVNGGSLRLFRVYSPFNPRKEARVWARSEAEAKKESLTKEPVLKRYSNLKALPI